MAIFLVLLVRDPGPVERLLNMVFDTYQQTYPREPDSVEKMPIGIVSIDEFSLTEIGDWPWPHGDAA